MNWISYVSGKAKSAEKLLSALEDPGEGPIPFDELAELGIILDPSYPLNRGPSLLKLVRLALAEKAHFYRGLAEALS